MKRLLSILLVIIMLVGLIPLGAIEVFAVNGVVFINGDVANVLKASQTTVQLGDGYAEFDPETNHLRLENCTISRNSGYSIDDIAPGDLEDDDILGNVHKTIFGICCRHDLTIELVGVNKIQLSDCDSKCGIYVNGDLTIYGDGELFVTTGHDSGGLYTDGVGIYATGDLRQLGGKIYAVANGSVRICAGVVCDTYECTPPSDGERPYLVARGTGCGLKCTYMCEDNRLCSYYSETGFEGLTKQDSYVKNNLLYVYMPTEDSSASSPIQVNSAEDLSLFLSLNLEEPVYLSLGSDISHQSWNSVEVYGTKVLDLNGHNISGYADIVEETNGYDNNMCPLVGYTRQYKYMFKVFGDMTVNDSAGNVGEVTYKSYIYDHNDDGTKNDLFFTEP